MKTVEWFFYSDFWVLNSSGIDIFSGRSDGLLNLAGAQASRADADALYRAILQDPETLQVGIEFPGPNVVRVRDRVTEHRGFFAHITLPGHGKLLWKNANASSMVPASQSVKSEGSVG
jgi:hypothetical protein